MPIYRNLLAPVVKRGFFDYFLSKKNMSDTPQHISQHLKTTAFLGQELVLPSADFHSIIMEMDSMKRRFPQIFSNLNIVINLSEIKTSEDEATELLLSLKEGLTALGHQVVGCTGVNHAVASACSIKPVRKKIEDSSRSLMTGSKSKELDKPETPANPEKNPEHNSIEKVESLSTKFINGPIRGGQQVYAKGTNLVIKGDVKHGAEIAADGCITVFGKVEGRAHAGVKSSSATIMVTHFDPELVSIGGTFLPRQDIDQDALNQSVLIQLQEDQNKLIVHLS